MYICIYIYIISSVCGHGVGEAGRFRVMSHSSIIYNCEVKK